MKIAIIGAGFTGLSAAYKLVKAGHQVDLYEANSTPGGLAGGFKAKNWAWALEKHYHHVFASDKDFYKFFQELGLADLIFFQTTKTANLYNGQIDRLDSVSSLLTYPHLSIVDRFRTGFGMAFFKLWPFGKVFEKFSAKELLIKLMGKKSWQIIWEPLFVGKFGELANKINAAWFWARIYARTQQLGYFKGGFQAAAEKACEKLSKLGVNFYFSSRIETVKNKNQQVILGVKGKTKFYDKVLFTQPLSAVLKIYPALKELLNKQQLASLKTGLAAQTLVLLLDKKFFADQTYWLSINEKDWPFLAVVEHTNFIDKAHYDKQVIVYVAKYLDKQSKEFKLDKEELLKIYRPYLEKLNPQFMSNLKNTYLFKEEFAQPVVFKNHSQLLPGFKLNEQLYWASMQHIYPFDRGINYAVRVGFQVANLINHSKLNV